MDTQTKAYKKAYRHGYNNPGQFDQTVLLNSKDDLAKAVIAGICQRKQDQANGTVTFL